MKIQLIVIALRTLEPHAIGKNTNAAKETTGALQETTGALQETTGALQETTEAIHKIHIQTHFPERLTIPSQDHQT